MPQRAGVEYCVWGKHLPAGVPHPSYLARRAALVIEAKTKLLQQGHAQQPDCVVFVNGETELAAGLLSSRVPALCDLNSRGDARVHGEDVFACVMSTSLVCERGEVADGRGPSRGHRGKGVRQMPPHTYLPAPGPRMASHRLRYYAVKAWSSSRFVTLPP